MDELNIGTSPPMCPRSIFLEEELKSVLEGKTITGTVWERYYTGKYSWHGDCVPHFDELAGQKIIFADASYILTDKGMLIFYAYMDGGIRYFNKGEEINIPKAAKPTSHGYHAKFSLDGGSSLGVNLYGWGTLLKIHKVDIGQIDNKRAGKSERYPFLPKSPIDITDEEDFTYQRFNEWLSINPGVNIIEVCATANGSFRIDIPVMNYILLVSKVHPRTKAKALNEDDFHAIYGNAKTVVTEYKSKARVCGYTDIYGKTVRPQNDVLWMTSAVLGAPCPVCGSPIEATPAAGTKMYFCPGCQVIKK